MRLRWAMPSHLPISAYQRGGFAKGGRCPVCMNPSRIRRDGRQ